MEDGGICDEASDCSGGNCGGGVCCALGAECCLVAQDCDPPVDPPACDNTTTCQGHAYDVICGASATCQTVEVPDDTACGPTVEALTCSPYTPVNCSGAADQLEPVCPTTCQDDLGCADQSVCTPTSLCEPITCQLVGAKDLEVDCALHLVRGSLTNPVAVQYQLTLDFDPASAKVESLDVCGELEDPFNFECTPEGGECDVIGDPDVYCGPTLKCSKCTSYSPDSKDAKLATGHTIETCAQAPGVCPAGQLALLFWGAESKPLNDSWLEDGLVKGNSLLVNVKFVLDKDLAQPSSVTINSDDFVATDAKAKSLPVQVQHSQAPNPTWFVVTGTP